MQSVTDLELQSLGIRRGKPRPWGWFFAGLVAVAGVGFVVSYYLPLKKAHEILVPEHEQLGNKAMELDHALRATKEKLASTEKQRVALQTVKDKQDAAQKASSYKLEIVEATLKNVLASHLKVQHAAIDRESSRLVVTLGKIWVFLPSSARVSPSGQKLLCAAAKVLASDANLRVTVSVPVASDAPTDDWPAAGEQAASAAAVLHGSCGAVPHGLHAEIRPSASPEESLQLVVTASPAD